MRSFSTERRRALAAVSCAWLAAAAGSAARVPAVAEREPEPAPVRAPAEPPVVFTEQERARILQYSPLGPLPADPTNAVADDPRAARLGQMLFFDARLSRGGFSCASCHVPPHAFTDGKPVSEAIARGRRRTPSLLNVAYRRWFFWDGRKDTLWSQALSPIENEVEMGGNRLAVAHVVAGDPDLRASFEDVFGPLPDLSDPVRFPPDARPRPFSAQTAAASSASASSASPSPASASPDPLDAAWKGMQEEDRRTVDRIFARVGKALEAYERRLVGRGSAFDRFLAELRAGGGGASLSEPAKRGLRLFVGRGNCRICHSGPDLSDGEFHDVGVPPAAGLAVDNGRYGGIEELLADPFNARGPFADGSAAAAASGSAATPAATAGGPSSLVADKLRALRRQPEHWGQFKTPSLRNVAVRPPYMHQGQLASLRDVLKFYSTREGATPPGPAQERLLVPLNLSERETADLVAFLESLTDEPLDDALLFRPGDPQLPAPAHRAP